MIPTLLLATTLTSAPAAAGGDCVHVMPTGIDKFQVGGARARFELVLQVERSCGAAVTLKRLDYQVEVNGVQLTEQVVDYDGIKLAKGGTAEVRVPVDLDAGEAASLAWTALSRAELAVGISGKARVRWLLFPLTVAFEEEVVRVGR